VSKTRKNIKEFSCFYKFSPFFTT